MSAVEAKTIGESAEQAEVDLTLDNISIVPDSLCMACGGSGETRIMLTKIPLFREVLLSSFACPHCGERNTEVQFGGETQPKGCRMAVTCSSREDLDRQVVKSESCKVLVPDLELEIPAATQRGVVTTPRCVAAGISSSRSGTSTLHDSLLTTCRSRSSLEEHVTAMRHPFGCVSPPNWTSVFRSPQWGQAKLDNKTSRKRGIFVSMILVSPDPPQAMHSESGTILILSNVRSTSACSALSPIVFASTALIVAVVVSGGWRLVVVSAACSSAGVARALDICSRRQMGCLLAPAGSG